MCVLLEKARNGPANRKQQRSDGVVEVESTEQQGNECFYMHWGYGNRKDKSTSHSLMDTHCVSRDGAISCRCLSDVTGPFVQ